MPPAFRYLFNDIPASLTLCHFIISLISRTTSSIDFTTFMILFSYFSHNFSASIFSINRIDTDFSLE